MGATYGSARVSCAFYNTKAHLGMFVRSENASRFGFEVLNCWQEEIDKLLGCTSSSLLMAMGYQNVSSRTRVTNPTCLFASTVVICYTWDILRQRHKNLSLDSTVLSTFQYIMAARFVEILDEALETVRPCRSNCLTYLHIFTKCGRTYPEVWKKAVQTQIRDSPGCTTYIYKILQDSTS